ncbi:MAG TPA: DUF4331 domain-containing protein [Nocardioides sp.]|uniref:DUF4331 domain-containing protein n=1 Tax=uncultured Nocardioides sp. TaxID=198441 RepID=UPI00262CDAF3|nr:DUF4331 domain-containing protein [uncultured Nocardioides sp.]HRD59592.1 DUF4331 domain-containing protein [Nocardioides sp.]HRI95117.1 DUF4331 domain-containing protein [Nocardioides sp.]HRK45647.1 DUF4331 domain-containing protein [Nocardioides sp.]
MSSHREAPEISKDPVADSTDVYAFVSPDRPDTVTLIANYIPLQAPDGGPNFYEFGDDVLYEIHISNGRKAEADITYQFEFHTKIRNKDSFLYNTGPITDIHSSSWNRPQFYSVTRVENGRSRVLAKHLACPPVNVGPRSTPNYGALAAQAVHTIKGGRKVFAGQRADAFHVDLGSVFDLGALRPVNHLHLISMPDTAGVNSVQGFNVHTLALQVPKRDLTRDGKMPSGVGSGKSVVGVWATASRRKSKIWDSRAGKYVGHGPWKQVSRLGNPLFNEVIVPMAEKDLWNARPPSKDSRFAKYVDKPELAKLLPVLYPGVFPNLAAYGKKRADLNAILLTGIPRGVVPGFQNFTGPVASDMLRLNLAVPPSATENPLGLVAGDAAGFPNGRRLGDDVVTIALRAVAGLTLPLVDPSFTPDGAASAVADGTTNTNSAITGTFPYLGLPGGGYQTVPGTTAAS